MMDKFDAEDEKAKLSSKSASAPSSSRPKPYTPQPSTRTARREAFFLSFAQRAHSVLPSSSRMVIILTGGLRSRAGMASALSSGEIDMVALGRPAAVDPALPLRLLDRAIPDSDARAKTVEYTIPASAIAGKLPIQLVGAGWGMQWHCAQMARVAYGLGVDLHAPVGELMWTLFVPPESGRNLGKHVAALTVLIAFLVALGTTYLSIR